MLNVLPSPRSHLAEAEVLLRQALEIFQRIGAADAAEIADELQALSDARRCAEA